ncbi:uncharacterized protein FTOL_13885 [Fusarium torulosum]|uniref:Uncharacterized protein n=1 Tax=Fusarium torulosum TaxID=33205 RepID=A0AAE8MQ81_9HYPO|nr:uncharacterized protein FTOL_13885 [Fusarium torulosum]
MPTEMILAPNCAADMPAALDSHPGHRQRNFDNAMYDLGSL